MRVVAIDTSTWWGGVALVEEDGVGLHVRGETGLLVSGSHAPVVLGLVEGLLAAAGWPRETIDLFVATRGPGSFTGIRVGLGTARGLALAAGRPVLGVGTLDAMADAAGPGSDDRLPLLDAGRGEVYGMRFDAAGVPPRAREDPWVGPPERALAGGGRVRVFGPGAERHSRALREAGLGGPEPATPRGVAASAGRIGALAHRHGRPDGSGIEPLYVRPSDAELPARRRG